MAIRKGFNLQHLYSHEAVVSIGKGALLCIEDVMVEKSGQSGRSILDTDSTLQQCDNTALAEVLFPC